MQTYHIQRNRPETSYAVCYDNGAKYGDGSTCYRVMLCHTEEALQREVAALKAHGYIERNP